MPCYLCQNPGHNRRSATCPVNIANRNGTRPTAELRPRVRSGPVGPTGQPTGPTGPVMYSADSEYYQVSLEDQMKSYMLLYQNMRPVRQFDDVDGRLYCMYRLLVVPGQLAIPNFYIRSTDNTVIIRRFGMNYFTWIGYQVGTSLHILNGSPLPDTDNLYIIIPQIPGFNVPDYGTDHVHHIPAQFAYETPNVVSSGIAQDHSAITMFKRHIQSMKFSVDDDETKTIEENTCAVCLDTKDASKFVFTNCKHGYCSGCITKHIKTQCSKFMNRNVMPRDFVELPCPLCRTNISELMCNSEEQRYLIHIFVEDEILATI
jgi:hypothetical protein